MDGYQILCFIIAHLLFSNAFSVENLESESAIHSIKTIYGDIYDCVDTYRQPALNHPLLKDHKIQMPSNLAEGTDALNATIHGTSATSINVGMKGRCPLGTVPIRRTTKLQRMRAKTNFKKLLQSSYSTNGGIRVGLIFAGISTPMHTANVYYGAAAFTTIENPAAVGPQRLSASVVSIEGGPREAFSVIRVGWMVHPDLFHDNQTRMYTLWGQGDKGIMHGCYNTYCPGFVQTNPSIPLDMPIGPYSVIHGPKYYTKFSVNKDRETGNWWLIFGADDQQVGYWPSALFTNLKDGANSLKWGGMVYSLTTELPQMGNGDNGQVESAHFTQVQRRDQSQPTLNGTIDVPMDVIQTSCYKAGDNSQKTDPSLGYSFYYGGEGGDAQKCSN